MAKDVLWLQETDTRCSSFLYENILFGKTGQKSKCWCHAAWPDQHDQILFFS